MKRSPLLTFLLWDLQSPINIGMILRLAETYRCAVAIRDGFGVLADAAKRKTISDFACGALERAGYVDVAPASDWPHRRDAGARLIGSSIEQDSVALPGHRFEPGDIVVLGNEYDGLNGALLSACDLTLRVPMADVVTPKPRAATPIDPTRRQPVSRDGQPSLNVAMTAAIIAYAAFAKQ